VVVALLGLAIPSLRWLYDYAWFVGFAVSGGSYVMLMSGERTAALSAEAVERGRN